MFCAHHSYIQDVQNTAALNIDWEKLHDSSILISGASGLIGTFLVDVLMFRNEKYGMNCRIYALGRSFTRAQKRFHDYFSNDKFTFTPHDINEPLKDFPGNCDYVMHMASNTHPADYAADPVGTILTNITGLNNLLRFATEHSTKRFLFTSTVEVYGQNRGDTEFFDEEYCGYIDIAKARAGYPEAKRCGETLCQSYIQQYGLDVVIPRLPRTYGATMLENDSKAIAQFIHNGLNHEDIVLKSAGTQLFSYAYVADAVAGILTVLLHGEKGMSYNVADENSDVTLKDLAGIIAEHSGQKVIFDLDNDLAKQGYSSATLSRLNPSRLKALGWTSRYDMRAGITRTLDILGGW